MMSHEEMCLKVELLISYFDLSVYLEAFPRQYTVWIDRIWKCFGKLMRREKGKSKLENAGLGISVLERESKPSKQSVEIFRNVIKFKKDDRAKKKLKFTELEPLKKYKLLSYRLFNYQNQWIVTNINVSISSCTHQKYWLWKQIFSPRFWSKGTIICYILMFWHWTWIYYPLWDPHPLKVNLRVYKIFIITQEKAVNLAYWKTLVPISPLTKYPRKTEKTQPLIAAPVLSTISNKRPSNPKNFHVRKREFFPFRSKTILSKKTRPKTPWTTQRHHGGKVIIWATIQRKMDLISMFQRKGARDPKSRDGSHLPIRRPCFTDTAGNFLIVFSQDSLVATLLSNSGSTDTRIIRRTWGRTSDLPRLPLMVISCSLQTITWTFLYFLLLHKYIVLSSDWSWLPPKNMNISCCHSSKTY